MKQFSWLAASFVTLTFAALTGVAAATTPVKWHPGHYVFIDHDVATPEVLSLPQFRGIQKIFTWRALEPEKDHYDFSSVRATLDLARKHNRQLIIQLTYKSFIRDVRSIPDYIQGPDYGGGVYRTEKGAWNPVLWNTHVLERFLALVRAFGREFDRDPNLEAVNLPETAPSANLIAHPQEGVDPYTEPVYFEALKRQIRTLRESFPGTVVIQYTNYPTNLLEQLTDFEKEIGVGMGGPDVYPGIDAINDPVTGVYRLYKKMAGIVPIGAAVQESNYSVAEKKRNAKLRGLTTQHGLSLTITPEDEILFSPREHIRIARDELHLNYLFWAMKPAPAFEGVKKTLAEPDIAADPAGGLHATLPPKAFLK